MRRTRVQMMAAALFAAAVMSGCGEKPYELTEKEEALIVDYSAHVVAKYNAYQKEGLTMVFPEETEATEENTAAAEETLPEQSAGTDVSSETAQPPVTEDTQIQEETYVPASWNEVFAVPGIEFSYVGASFADSYMEDDYFAMYPDAGKKYLLLEVNIMNTGSEPVEVNSLPGADAFTVRLGQDITATAEQTVLTEDFSSMAGTIDAGETKKAVLLFQIPAEVTAVENAELIVTTDQNYQIVLGN